MKLLFLEHLISYFFVFFFSLSVDSTLMFKVIAGNVKFKSVDSYFLNFDYSNVQE